MRVPAAAERAIWALIRANIAAGGHLARVAEGALDVLRPAPPPPSHDLPQRVLWGVDGEGLPLRPWRVQPDDVFDCVALDCRDVTARVCVVRQLATEVQRTEQASRGQGTEYPLCDTRKCAQGRGIREALDPSAKVAWQGAGTGWLGRFERTRSRQEQAKQEAARERLEREGRLEPVRTLDVDRDPEPVEE